MTAAVFCGDIRFGNRLYGCRETVRTGIFYPHPQQIDPMHFRTEYNHFRQHCPGTVEPPKPSARRKELLKGAAVSLRNESGNGTQTEFVVEMTVSADHAGNLARLRNPFAEPDEGRRFLPVRRFR